MGLYINKYDFENIQNRIDAAKSLQDAGLSEDCNKIMDDIAKEIEEDGS